MPIAAADAPSAQAINSPAAEAPAQPPAKQLFTVPEDGMGDKHWLSGATRFVREMLAKRPNEDLVICIAGCVPKQDRVVYAQPAEAPASPVDTVSDAAPITAPEAINKIEFVPSMAAPKAPGAHASPNAGQVQAN